MCAAITCIKIFSRFVYVTMPIGHSKHRKFHGLSNKKNRNQFEAKLASSVANVYTHTNTNFDTQKRQIK